jgi:hypothetical protein
MLAKEFELPKRRCSSCNHWRKGTDLKDKGYLERVCVEPSDDRDRKYKRGSDSCSRWMKIFELAPLNIPDYGY